MLQRFKQELILAREVTHRNVVRIFDLGQADGIRFITMEYVEGTVVGTLIKRIQERAVPPADLDAEVPRTLTDVVIKCLAIERNDRYQSAAEVLRDLENWETRRVTPPKVEPLQPCVRICRAPQPPTGS